MSKELDELEAKVKKIEEANKLLKSVEELKQLGNQVQDLQIARKEKEIRELKDAKFKNRDASGRLIKKKLYDTHGEEI